MISMVEDELILLAKREIIRRTDMAPMVAATGKPIVIPVVPRSKMATPRFAPELTPRTKGPASGFLKIVCMINPDTERAIPEIKATKV